MTLDRLLTWFMNGWVCLIFAINALNIIGTLLFAPTVWAGIAKVQDIYSPLNLTFYLIQIVLLSPAFGAYLWRERRANSN